MVKKDVRPGEQRGEVQKGDEGEDTDCRKGNNVKTTKRERRIK